MRISYWSSDVCSSDLNLHTRVEPERFQRQVRLFHEIVPFKTLGIVYENSKSGRTYAAVDAVEQVSRELGFSVKPCYAQSSSISTPQAIANAVDCYGRLAGEHVDAVYRSEEHTSELQSLMRTSYAVFCLKKKKN